MEIRRCIHLAFAATAWISSLAILAAFYRRKSINLLSTRRGVTRSVPRRLGTSSTMVLSSVMHTLFPDGTAASASPVSEETCSASSTTTTASASPKTRPTPTVSVEGVELPGVRLLEDGTPLYRNGHGIRSITFFGMNIKVYVAHLYSHKPLVNEEQALNATIPRVANPHHHHHNPLHFDFTFLRHVGKSRVESAWTQQLEHSVSHRYQGYEQDRDAFIELCSSGPIVVGGTQTVQLVGEETRIIDQGTHKGIIRGKDFQRSFLSMWFGHKAVAEDLKQDLLKGHETVPTPEAVPVMA